MAENNDPKDIYVPCMAEQNITIRKEYGPLVACDVRVRLDFQTAEWVIEKECQKKAWSKEHDCETCETSWKEVSRFDCQESLNLDEFRD